MEIQRPPGYEAFFTPLAVCLDPNTFERVQFAYFASKYGHARQIREDGSRYFDHPKSAAWIYIHELGGRDPRVIMDILLHDVQEDAYLLSTYRINLNFGTEVALDVRALTKYPKGKETIEQYFQRIIERGIWSIIAKLCDRLHNLRSLAVCSPEKQQKQIIETRDCLMPLLINSLRTYDAESIIHADKLELKLNEAMALYCPF